MTSHGELGKKSSRDPVVVDGVRTPFMRSHKAFVDLSAYDLGRLALGGLVSKTEIDPGEVGQVVLGTVLHDPRTPNVARESVLGAGFPATVPAYTVSLACISSNVAATNASDMIRLGRLDSAIFGGTDTCSDPPIRVSARVRKALVKLEKAKSPMDFLRVISKLGLRDIRLDVPKVAEFSNGKSMGEGAELLAQQSEVSRVESDRFAARSHQKSCEAWDRGEYSDFVIPVSPPPRFQTVEKDDGPRADTTEDRLAKLRPAFDRKFGVSTAGSSSFLTDGASAVLMLSRERSESLGKTPMAVIRDYVYRAGDALSEMLSGPALSIPHLLTQNGLKVDDIGVWEIHEAFACQVLANLKFLTQDEFAQKRLGLEKAIGEIPLEKINTWGGSLSLGHPFGATGGRLIWTAAKRLQKENERFAVVSGCAAGGHGSAILLENANI